VNGQVALGAPRTQNIDATALTNATPDQLCLYWSNGVTWIKLGGVRDSSSPILKTRSAHLGNYQLRIAAKAASLNLDKANVFPSLFTPNNDGFNDRVYFILENPNNAAVTGEILDIDGRHVTTLPTPSLTGGGSATLTWNGNCGGGDG
jgi:hypothetical protein